MQHEDKVHGSDSVWCVQRYPAEDGAGAHGERRTQLFALRDENVRETTALHKDPRPHRRTRSSRRLHFSPYAYTNTKDSFHWRCFRSQRSQAHTHTKLDCMERNDTLTLKFFNCCTSVWESYLKWLAIGDWTCRSLKVIWNGTIR